MSKTAVLLYNLGGPDGADAVQPFLFNLFNDPAIIGLPTPFRYLLAKLISRRRAPVARKIYDQIGGASPLLPLTIEQANALKERLADGGGAGLGQVEVFIVMRYWHPMSGEVARRVKDFGPDRVIALPLYPQFSTTTTGSSMKDWERAAARVGLKAPTTTICCYPLNGKFIDAHAAMIREMFDREAEKGAGAPRLLFSAHGLPRKIVEAGDPYQWQVEQTARAVVDRLAIDRLDWTVCYQSRVGPLEWIGPSTEDEIARAGAEGKALMVVPIAFVSEHSETLVELDREYADLARNAGVPHYCRVPALGTNEAFIDGLAEQVRLAAAQPGDCALTCEGEGRLCPAALGKCPNARV